MAMDDKFRDEKLKYNIHREAEKISTLSSGKIRKYEYLSGEEILTSGPSQALQKQFLIKEKSKQRIKSP